MKRVRNISTLATPDGKSHFGVICLDGVQQGAASICDTPARPSSVTSDDACGQDKRQWHERTGIIVWSDQSVHTQTRICASVQKEDGPMAKSGYRVELRWQLTA